MQFPLGERWVGVVLAVAVTLSACGPDARDSVGVATYPTNVIEQEVSAIDNRANRLSLAEMVWSTRTSPWSVLEDRAGA